MNADKTFEGDDIGEKKPVHTLARKIRLLSDFSIDQSTSPHSVELPYFWYSNYHIMWGQPTSPGCTLCTRKADVNYFHYIYPYIEGISNGISAARN